MLIVDVRELEEDIKINPFVVDPEDPLGVYKLMSYTPKVIERIMQNITSQSDEIKFIYSNGAAEVYHYKQVVFNIIWWRIFVALKIPVLPEDFWEFKNINENSIAEIHTAIKDKCIVPGADRKKIVSLMYESVPMYYNFIHRYCCEYATGISLMKLYTLANQPDVRAICNIEHLKGWGSKDVEVEIETRKALLINLFITKYPDSPITRYLVTDTLNVNQLVQMFIGYGPRSDVNDRVIGDPILHGTLDGLRDTAEFAVESLAAKKAAVYNKASVRDSAYSNRQGHLTLCEIYRVDPHPCDNEMTVELYLDKDNYKWFLGKYIVEDGRDVLLSKRNIKTYLDKPINMVSAIDCRRRYAICSRCMGEMSQYIPADMHLGLTTGSEVLSRIMQNILSAKHMVKTNTIAYALTPEMAEWFSKRRNGFYLKSEKQSLRLMVPEASTKKFWNINKAVNVRESDFSTLRSIALIDGNHEVLETLEIAMAPIYPYWSTDFIDYLIKNKDRVTKERGMYIIPLDNWDRNKPMFKIETITFDMNAYVKSVQDFLNKDICNYHDTGEVLKDFCATLYKKSNVNIFLAEILIKALMITSPTDFNFPIRDKGEPAYFGTLRDVISNRAMTPKLAFENLLGKEQMQYFQKPSTYLVKREMGMFAPFFNLAA